jgi:hypothetical protein
MPLSSVSYYRARYYEPNAARFLNEDPLARLTLHTFRARRHWTFPRRPIHNSLVSITCPTSVHSEEGET